MDATPALAVSIGSSDPTSSASGGHRPRFIRPVVQGGMLVIALLAAGALFWGVPTVGGRPDLPSPAAMAFLGRAHNSSAENVEFWQARVDRSPRSAPALTQLANAQLALAGDTGDLAGYEVAETTAARAVGLTPEQPGALLALAHSLAGQHDFAGALRLAEEVLDDNPVNVGALLTAGDSQLELGEYIDARLRYDRAAELTGGGAAILSRYARLEATIGSIDEAMFLARRALVEAADIDLRNADAAFYWFQLASYEFATGDASGAAGHLRDALRIDPTHPGSTELLAKTLTALGDDTAAIDIYEQMLDGGGAADLHGELARLYERAGRTADARQQIDLGLAVAAETADRFPAERRHLIGFLAEHDPAEALRLAELDLATRRDVQTHGWYAWALFRNGRFDDAAVAIVPALTYGTEDALLRYHAGEIMAAVGDTASARALLTSALDLNPNFHIQDVARARELLADLDRRA
jgi:tetratricopeptide (TPR) repeat protein